MRRAAALILSVSAGCAMSQGRTPAPSVAPLLTASVPPHSTIPPPAVMPARYLRTLEYDPGGYDAVGTADGSPIAGKASDLLLGDLLFHSPHTLGPRAAAMGVSCDTCHPNGATHAALRIDPISDRPGNVDLSSSFFRPASDDGIFDPINIPSLRGVRYTAPYGHDGRTGSLSEFVRGVVSGEFDGQELSAAKLSALVRYVLDLDFLPNSQLDARGALSERASEAARRGAKLFSSPRAGFGGGSCATCHTPSSFFVDGRSHRLGTGNSPSPHAVDGGYETPTLLGLAETAPYFHDGRFATIEGVVDWFDTSFALGLAPAEREDLTAYVEAVGAVDRPRDDRPLARRLDQTFSYLSLLTPSEVDATVWVAAIDAVAAAIEGPDFDPARERPELEVRVKSAADRLMHLRTRVQRPGAPSRDDAKEARALRLDLSRLAADRAGLSLHSAWRLQPSGAWRDQGSGTL